ncbi:MAG TPA: hypothetical protein VES60_09465 [Nakamurella sp.]|nr:hypothetical protein [Nakamurella sp.]
MTTLRNASAGRRLPLREIGIVTIAAALLSLAFVLLVAAPASAHQQEDAAVTHAAAAPMMPAGNGLDIAAPVTIGLGLLFLGTVVVGWAFLANGRQDRRGSPFGSGR